MYRLDLQAFVEKRSSFRGVISSSQYEQYVNSELDSLRSSLIFIHSHYFLFYDFIGCFNDEMVMFVSEVFGKLPKLEIDRRLEALKAMAPKIPQIHFIRSVTFTSA